MAEATAVIFDLDGTLVDSSRDIAAALNRVLIPRGGTALSAQRIVPLLGEGVPRLVEGALRAVGLSASDDDIQEVSGAYLSSYRAHPVVHSVLYEGVADALAALRDDGALLGVCTNKNEAIAHQVLAGLGVDTLFGAVVGADRVETPKPHPSHLLATFSRLGSDPAHGLFVGDSGIDEACARAANVAFVAVPWAQADVVGMRLGSFADLLVHRLTMTIPDGQEHP